MAVVLSGVGYKLSQHRQAAPSSRVPVTQLWIESRDVSEAMASRFKAKSRLVPGLQASSLPIQQFLRLSCAVVRIHPVSRRDVAIFDFPIPFRSPPPHRFRLA